MDKKKISDLGEAAAAMDGGGNPHRFETESLLKQPGGGSTSSLLHRLKVFLSNHNMSGDVIKCIVLYFFSMIGEELALEAVTAEFSHLDSLASAVTMVSFGWCLVLPAIMTKGKALSKFPRSFQQLVPYVYLSVVIAAGTGLATHAVKYVSYPTKIVFKSGKLIPTMVFATIIHRKIYGPREYAAAIMLCCGAAGYSYASSGSASSASATANNDNWKGILLLVTSVISDAAAPNLQKRFMTPPAKGPNPSTAVSKDALPLSSSSGSNGSSGSPSKHSTSESSDQQAGLTASELMINVNSVGFFVLLVYMAVVGDLTPTVNASVRNPLLFWYLTAVGMCLASAVWNYTSIIRSSGSVIAVGVATLRKVVTFVLSFIVFPKPITYVHVLSGLLVLAGITLSSIKPHPAAGPSIRTPAASIVNGGDSSR